MATAFRLSVTSMSDQALFASVAGTSWRLRYSWQIFCQDWRVL